MIQSGILAIQFLTRIPINIPIDFNNKNLRGAIFFFPFIGMLLGFIIYLVYYLFSFLNKEIGAVFSVLSLIVLTGGLHLDGLSDTCDGFFSNKNREDMLEIMRDSRVGAFGVISLIIIILLKYVLISNLDENIMIILVLSLGNSRLVQSHKIGFKKSAREEGLGVMFKESNPNKYIIISGIIYIFLVGLINIKYLIPLLINFLIGEMISKYTYKKIGGFTGDVLGATAEIGEVVSILSFIGVMKWI